MIVPLYVGIASIVTLVLHLLWASKPALKLRATYFKSPPPDPEHEPHAHSVAGHIVKHGGPTIVGFKLLRLVLLLRMSH